MIICCHLCLLTDGSWGRFPIAELDEGGVIRSLRLCPDGPEEIGGMTFVGGVMLCGVADNVSDAEVKGRADFASQFGGNGVGVGRGPVCVMRGADLNTFCGTFWKQTRF